MTATTTQTRSTDRDALRRRRALGVAGAVAAALAIWVVAVPLLGVDLHVTPGTEEVERVGPGMVAVAGLGAGLAGWGSFALLERSTVRAVTVWRVAALVVLGGSLAGPLAGVTAAATVSLAAMHVAVAAVLVAVLPSARRGAAVAR